MGNASPTSSPCVRIHEAPGPRRSPERDTVDGPPI